MLYPGSEQSARTGDPAGRAPDARRTFARRIDCEPAPRQAAVHASPRGGTPREHDAGERSRRAYGR